MSKPGSGFRRTLAIVLLLLAIGFSGCRTGVNQRESTTSGETGRAEPASGVAPASGPLASGAARGLEPLQLPPLMEVQLEGRKLRAVATTGIVGDVVSQVGGDAIDLTVLMRPGQDSHSYEPSAGDLTAVAQADVLFVTGWDLEQGLTGRLESIAEEVPQVPLSAKIQPLRFGSSAGSTAGNAPASAAGIDPHTWMDPHNGLQWAVNVREALAALNPTNAERFEYNLLRFEEELQRLIADFDVQIATIPLERRKLVTNHEALAYFARAYQFRLVGTIIPGGGTLAEPSARELANLVDIIESEGICAIFAETSANQELAQSLAREVTGCPEVHVETLYTEALGPPGSGADSYVGMMRANLQTIVAGLRE